MRRRNFLLYLLAPWVALLGACAGSGQGLDSSGRPVGSGGGGPLTADFQSIQDNVFTPICSVCHAGGAAPQGLRLDAANSYAMLVGVPSTEESSILRIKPGDPDNSYLVQKIEGHAAVGAQMPFGGPPLPAATIAVIRQWVTDGALRSVAVATVHEFAVTSAAPAPGDVVLEAPTRILIGMSHELDSTRVDSTSLRLERLDANSLPAMTIPATLALPVGNPTTLMIVPQQPLADGRYRVVVPPTPAAGLSDLGGQRLFDGDRDVTVSDFIVESGK